MKIIRTFRSQKSKYVFALTDCFQKSEVVDLTFAEFMNYKGRLVLEKNYRLSNKTTYVSEATFEKYAITI
jgi:hypothetical protein